MFASRYYVFALLRKRGVICAVTPILIKPFCVYWTFKHEMIRVGGSCNFPILGAHFLSQKGDNDFRIFNKYADIIITLL